MSNVLNPKTFTITDPRAGADKVTGFNVHIGTVSGTYTKTAAVPAKDLAGLSGGQVTGPVADLNLGLGNGTYFAVATAVNAVGESSPSPEFAFDVLGVPSPPTFTAA